MSIAWGFAVDLQNPIQTARRGLFGAIKNVASDVGIINHSFTKIHPICEIKGKKVCDASGNFDDNFMTMTVLREFYGTSELAPDAEVIMKVPYIIKDSNKIYYVFDRCMEFVAQKTLSVDLCSPIEMIARDYRYSRASLPGIKHIFVVLNKVSLEISRCPANTNNVHLFDVVVNGRRTSVFDCIAEITVNDCIYRHITSHIDEGYSYHASRRNGRNAPPSEPDTLRITTPAPPPPPQNYPAPHTPR